MMIWRGLSKKRLANVLADLSRARKEASGQSDRPIDGETTDPSDTDLEKAPPRLAG